MHYLFFLYHCHSQTTDQRFPDAEFRIGYSGTQPGCVGSSQVQDDVAPVVYSCLNDSSIAFNATYVDLPDCMSSTVTIQPSQLPACMCDILCMLCVYSYD